MPTTSRAIAALTTRSETACPHTPTARPALLPGRAATPSAPNPGSDREDRR
jgi:hypothetical protein